MACVVSHSEYRCRDVVNPVHIRHYLQAAWRDTRVLMRQFRLSLLAFAVLLSGGSAALHAYYVHCAIRGARGAGVDALLWDGCLPGHWVVTNGETFRASLTSGLRWFLPGET
jgi:hypothetical protein